MDIVAMAHYAGVSNVSLMGKVSSLISIADIALTEPLSLSLKGSHGR